MIMCDSESSHHYVKSECGCGGEYQTMNDVCTAARSDQL